MAHGPPPIELLRRLEAVCEGELADEIIFCLGIIMGRMISHTTPPEHYREVIEAALNAIQAGLHNRPTEH